jgi:hypothetical protein
VGVATSTFMPSAIADRRKMPRDRPVAHDADGRAVQLAAHARFGFLALAI